MSALTNCIIDEDVQGLKSLLASGVDPNSYSDQGYTPLEMVSHLAYGVHLKMGQTLLQWGAEPNLPGKNGTTPLYAAVDRSDLACVRLLLRYGADPTVPSRQGVSPYQLAAKNLEFARSKTSRQVFYEPWLKGEEQIFRLLEEDIQRRARRAAVGMRLVCRTQDIPYDIIENVVRFV